MALDEAIALNRKVDDRFSLGWALHTRSLVALKQHDLAEATRCGREGLQIFTEAGDLSGMTLLIDDAASIVEMRGDMAHALRLAGAAVASRAVTGAGIGNIAGVNEGRDWLKSMTTDDHKREWQVGQALSLQEAAAQALSMLDATVEEGASAG